MTHTETNISLTIADANSSVVVNFGTGENPAAFSVPIGKGSWVARGNFSVPIDLTAANITTAIKGTIQVVLTGGDGVLYQCADVDFNPSATSGTTTGGSTGSSPSVSGTPAATGMPAKAGGSNAAVSTRTVANSALMLLPVLLPLFF
nr:hypothetical protein HK105_001363 [Polyrhizophydium stewartii]